MKLHKNLVEAVVEGLYNTFVKHQYADKVVEQLLKRDRRWGARDRGFIAESLYQIVRYKRLYQVAAGLSDLQELSHFYELFAVWAIEQEAELPAWLPFTGKVATVRQRLADFQQERKLRESVPDWLDALGEAELGVQWAEEVHALNETAKVVLRANTLRNSAQSLQAVLDKEGIATQRLAPYPDALVLEKRQNVFKTQAFKEGLFEVQDASSQRVAEFCRPQSGMRVVDTCAGAGGKTLHLSALMQNKGQIIAMDIFAHKLEELKKRAKRDGVFNVHTRLAEAKTLKRLAQTADIVLIDAPCSGLGVLKRNPDAKWKLTPEKIDQIRQEQAQILSQYSKIAKVGGKVVYATCSILPSENQQQVKHFLISPEGQAFRFVREEIILAHLTGFDGFYMAELVREK